MTSRPARPRTLLDFINRPILKGVAPAGNLKRVFTGKSGLNRKKFWESYVCVRNYSKLQKPYRPYRYFNSVLQHFLHAQFPKKPVVIYLFLFCPGTQIKTNIVSNSYVANRHDLQLVTNLINYLSAKYL